MRNLYNQLSLLFFLVLCSFTYSVHLSAKVAFPQKVEALQPDGTTISIILNGDFHNRLAISEDGFPLLPDENGFYNYAELNAEGIPVASGHIARNSEFRTSTEKTFLSSVNREMVKEKIIDNNLKNISPKTKGPGLFTNAFPSKGNNRSLAVLVEYQDKGFSLEDPNDYFWRLLNEEGFSDNGATGSARDYYISNSDGLFQPEFDVYGPITLANNMRYYGANNDARAHEMVIEACEQLDEVIDFSQYDANQDGYIDNVYIFYAGYGEADGGGSNTVWPHSWDLEVAMPDTIYKYDGVILNHYACSNELQHAFADMPDGIGSFCHEFGHVMGIPDLYSTLSTRAFTPGEWSIMDTGSYNNKSRTPPNFSAYERYALDWIEPLILNEAGDYTLENIADTNKAYIVSTENDNEFYLLENRQQVGNDLYLPGHGMLVWHIDYYPRVFEDNIVNISANHQYVDLVEADNKKSEKNRDGDTFPGAENITEFTCTSSPTFVSWSQEPVSVELYDIVESDDGVISFRAEKCEIAKVETVKSANKFIISGNHVSTLTGVADIYNIHGEKLATVGRNPLRLSAGFYVITDGKDTMKFIIK